MQPFQVFYLFILISLPTLIEAQYGHSVPAGCSDRCGNVDITYPFGIGRNCSANEWYTIDCNSSTPYLSALNNIEFLGVNQNTFTVNVPMASACGNPVQNSNLVLTTSHGKSPFQISGINNLLVVEGCGHATIMENGTIVSGCSTTCHNNTVTVSDRNNCFGIGCCQTTIPHDLESLTFNLTGLEQKDGDGTCGSAFLVDLSDAYSQSIFSIVKNHSFFPVSLSWNETFNNYTEACSYICGEMSIPYPFGIGRSCSYNEWYAVECSSSTPYLSALNMKVLGINEVKMFGGYFNLGRITVEVPMISDCENPVQNSSLVLMGSPFQISGTENIFVVEGCGNATIMDETGTIVSGCSTTCGNGTLTDGNNCFGIGCCQTPIYFDLDSFTSNITGLKRQGGDGVCGSAFLVDRNSFTQRKFSRQSVPITLSWKQGSELDSTECTRCKLNGGYCDDFRYSNSGMICRFHGSNKKGVILGASICMGSFLIMVTSYVLYRSIKKLKMKRRKQRFFKRNGGLLLKQQEENTGLVDRTILFTSNELEKATDQFNENRVIGRGGQGTVFKGMLADGRIVAIKKSKAIDESQLEQFINEVVILSQVNHRNVVKLLGCCLETEVPLLVSEFISNGTLYDLIQDENDEFSFSLNMRLQIATEVAGALSYLHSAASIPIYHRDIKTTNILLDEKYRAKVSDFGTSKFVSIDQTHLTTLVKGTFGYLDPEYFQSSQFTDKSDVYSFGVVLLELFTREKPISLTRFGLHRNLATYFMVAMEEGRVMTIFDAMIVNEGSQNELLAIANLALQCLDSNGKNRPTMKEVSIQLEGMRSSHVPSTFQPSFGRVGYGEQVPQIYGGSTPTSLTFDDDLCR